MRHLPPLLLGVALILTVSCGEDGNPSPGGSNNAGSPDAGDPNNDLVGDAGGDVGGEPESEPEGPAFPEGGPNELVDHAALRDPSTLQIVIDAQGSGIVQSGQSAAYLLNFTFVSQTFLGTVWRHQASLYVPLEGAVSDTVGIIQRGTENPVDRVSDNASFTSLFGILTAVNTGSPILILNDAPPPMDLNSAALAAHAAAMEPRCKGGPVAQPDVLTRCLHQVVRASGDPSLDPFLHIAIAYVRAITAVQALPAAIAAVAEDLGQEKPQDFEIRKAALFASSFRGAALPIAAAIDDRVAGIYQGGGAFGALEESFALQKRVWNEGFALGDPEAWEGFFQSGPGQTYLDRLDPARWPAALLADKVILHAWGTQQTFAPLRGLNLYRDKLPASARQFAIFDYADGLGTGNHLTLWQTFLMMARGQRELPSVQTSFTLQDGNITVSATVNAPSSEIGGVAILYVSRHREGDDLDFRDAVWDQVGTEPKGGGFQGIFTPTSRNTAYVVLVLDSATGTPPTEGLSSSDVIVIEP